MIAKPIMTKLRIIAGRRPTRSEWDPITMPPIGPVRNPAPNVRLPNPLKLLRTLLIKVLGEAANLLDRLSRGNLPIHAASPRGSKAQLVDMHARRLLLAAPARLSHLSPQQPVMHSGFLTSGRGSPTNMLRFGILTALSVLASSVASAGISPFRLRM
jgi:hypothetical protein